MSTDYHGIQPRCVPWPRCHRSAAAVRSHSQADNDITWAYIHRVRNGTELEFVEPGGVPSANVSLARRAVAQISTWLSGKHDGNVAWDEASCSDARRSDIQHVLDTIVSEGSWVNESWDLLTPLTDMSWSATRQVMANRSIVFMGGSTMRVLWQEFCRTYASNTSSWTVVKKRRCGFEGSGCKNCFMCCDALCQHGPHSAEHLDSTVYHKQTNLTVDFSWKPEIFDPRDVDAFEGRFCRRPPDLLVASKGLHDAAFYEFSGNETEWRSTYEAGLRRWLSLLRCLHGTQVIWRSPDLPTRQPREAALVILTESVARRAFRAGEFGGEAYLVDALKLTNAARAIREKSLMSVDGHHYPPPVLRAEWIMIFLARFLHWRRGVKLRRCEFKRGLQ